MNVLASTYIHALDGRLRIKLPKIKRASREALEVELRLHEVAGVEKVTANPTTGSVLILYHPGIIKQEEIVSFLMQSGYLPQPVGGSGTADSRSTMERMAASVASTILEAILFRLVGVLI